MAVELKQHVELRGDDPLDAVIAGTTIKAWLVANFAMLNSVEEAVAQYPPIPWRDLFSFSFLP